MWRVRYEKLIRTRYLSVLRVTRGPIVAPGCCTSFHPWSGSTYEYSSVNSCSNRWLHVSGQERPDVNYDKVFWKILHWSFQERYYHVNLFLSIPDLCKKSHWAFFTYFDCWDGYASPIAVHCFVNFRKGAYCDVYWDRSEHTCACSWGLFALTLTCCRDVCNMTCETFYRNYGVQ